VPQELQEAHIARQVVLTETTKHPQIGLEQGQQTRRPVRVAVTPCLRLLRMLDERVPRALHRPIAARCIRIEAAPRWDGEVGGLLHGLHRALFGRVDDHRPRAPAPGDHRRSVFILMPPPRVALLAAPTHAAPQGFLPPPVRLSLVACGMLEVIRCHCAC